VNLKIVASWGSSDIHVIVGYGDESVFPNLRIALQMMLTMGVSIASWEKLILSYLRDSMNQDRLCDQALGIEREEREKTDFDEIIDDFASIKARKVLFWVTCVLNKKRLAILMLRWNCVFLTIHVLHYITYYTIQIKCFSF